MNPSDHHDRLGDGPDDEPDAGSDGRLPLPCPHGLMAATLALMTRWAVPEPGCRLAHPNLRHVLARKVVSNLFFLQQHPQVPPGLRRVAQGLHAQWLPLATPTPTPTPTPTTNPGSAPDIATAKLAAPAHVLH